MAIGESNNSQNNDFGDHFGFEYRGCQWPASWLETSGLRVSDPWHEQEEQSLPQDILVKIESDGAHENKMGNYNL